MHGSRGDKEGGTGFRGARPPSSEAQTGRGFGGLVPTLLGRARPCPARGPEGGGCLIGAAASCENQEVTRCEGEGGGWLPC